MSILHNLLDTKFSKNKGQSAIEFMVMISLVLILFASFYTVFSQKEISAIKKETRLRAKSIADRVSYELNLALVQGKGFEKKFKLPLRISDKYYDLVINKTDQGSVIFLEWGNTFVSSHSAVSNITGSLGPGLNTIENKGGYINVS